MKNIILIFAFITISHLTSYACINYYTKSGTYSFEGSIDSFTKIPRAFDYDLLIKSIQQIEDSLRKGYSYELHSDYGAQLLKLGKTELALSIFKQLAKKHPKDYQIASNLGTAYELAGELDSAIHYMKESLRLFPLSHDSTEWVHVNILEAKIAEKNGENWFDKHKLFDKNGTNGLFKNIQPKSEKWMWHIGKVKNTTNIQLQTRAPFSKPPNKIMCQLLIEAGDLYANTISLERSYQLYKTAEFYQTDSQKKAIAKKLRSTRQIIGISLANKNSELLILPEPEGNKHIDIGKLEFPSFLEEMSNFYELQNQQTLIDKEISSAESKLKEIKQKWNYILLGLSLFGVLILLVVVIKVLPK